MPLEEFLFPNEQMEYSTLPEIARAQQGFEGNRQSTYMIFTLGIILFVIGFALSVITAEETRYRNVLGFQVPYQVTVYPFQPIGVLMILISVLLIGVSVYQTIKRGSGRQQ